MKFHSHLKAPESVDNTTNYFTNVPGDVDFSRVDNFLLIELNKSINSIIQGLAFVNSSSAEENFQLSNNDKASIKKGIEKCVQILHDDCINYYVHSSKEIFLQNAYKVIQGFIEHVKVAEQATITDAVSRNEKQIYSDIKNSELVKTWDLFDLFLKNQISKEQLLNDENLLEGFDGTKLDFSMFVLNEDGFIDWDASKVQWQKTSKSLITAENYLKIIEEPTCIIKDVNNLTADDDDELLISEGKVQLVCKISLAEFVKPMRSRCGHIFDDSSLRNAFGNSNYMSTRQSASGQCLEGACHANLRYPNDFKVDDNMLFRVACNKISTKK